MNKQQKQERGLHIGASLIAVVAMFAFTVLGFFKPQVCDIDKEFLWCHLHPLSVLSIIGCICFYAGALGLVGVTKLFKVDLNPGVGALSALVAVIGFILIWVS